VVAYARRDLIVDRDTDFKLGIGSNDGVRVWINGKLVLDRQVGRKALVNDDVVTVHLKKGVHDLLIKVDQLGNEWGLYCTQLSN
jgi:hypothetical protein